MFMLRFVCILSLGTAVADAGCVTDSCIDVSDEVMDEDVVLTVALLQTSSDVSQATEKKQNALMHWSPIFPEGLNPLVVDNEDFVVSFTEDECAAFQSFEDQEASLNEFPMPAGSPGARDGAILILSGDGGHNMGAFANAMGFYGFMINYRMPSNLAANISDTQRAMSLIRSRASELGFNASRIGLASVGGTDQIAAAVSTMSTRMYSPIDEVDNFPFAPDFTLMIFGSGNPSMAMNAPPTFLALEMNDPCVTVAQVMEYYTALLQNGKPHELHISSAGHLSFGMCFVDDPGDFQSICSWPMSAQLFIEQLFGFNSPKHSYPFGVTG